MVSENNQWQVNFVAFRGLFWKERMEMRRAGDRDVLFSVEGKPSSPSILDESRNLAWRSLSLAEGIALNGWARWIETHVAQAAVVESQSMLGQALGCHPVRSHLPAKVG
jgi:hypothetical protein